MAILEKMAQNLNKQLEKIEGKITQYEAEPEILKKRPANDDEEDEDIYEEERDVVHNINFDDDEKLKIIDEQ